MPKDRVRFSRLAPFSLEKRYELTTLALSFFGPTNNKRYNELLGRGIVEGKVTPFSGDDFIQLLSRTDVLPEAGRYHQRIIELLNDLDHAGFLTRVGTAPGPFAHGFYYFMTELTSRERKGELWLSRALGPSYILKQYQDYVVQLIGVDEHGDVRAGTGLVIGPNVVLTCAHVISGMTLSQEQSIKGHSFTVSNQRSHNLHDVGLVYFDSQFETLPDLAFQAPQISQQVLTIGYPRVPLSKEPVMVVQTGEVTSTLIETLYGHEVFLYSAIARPGNSGGPILSGDGLVVGIVTEELSEEGFKLSTPFYAGVAADQIQMAVSEIDSDIEFPIEDYS